MAFFKSKKTNKKGNWEREDKLLDYIGTHKKEITRYLIVVLISELLKTALGILCGFSELTQALFPGIVFFVWGLPYFIVCKLWVWQQRGDNAYVWAKQGMFFFMSVVIVELFTNLARGLIAAFSPSAGAILLSTLVGECLYFFAMYKFVLKPKS